MSTDISRDDMMRFAEEAGFLPNTIHRWEGALTRFTKLVVLAASPEATPNETDISDELIPCPFCGGGAVLIDRPDGPLLVGAYAGCDACDISTPIKPNAAEAIAAWNRRAAQPEATAAREQETWDYEVLNAGGEWCKESRTNGPPDTDMFVIRNLRKRSTTTPPVGTEAPAVAEPVAWAACETRAPMVRNSLKARIADLRAAERKSRRAFTKPYMGEPCAYLADAYAEAAEVLERHLSLAAPSSPRAASPEPVEMSPDFTDTARSALLWVLWHHQGGSSKVGQPIRFALGMGQFDRLNEHQLSEAKRWGELHGAEPARVALTEAQIDSAWINRPGIHGGELMPQLYDLVRAVEIHHGIGIAAEKENGRG